MKKEMILKKYEYLTPVKVQVDFENGNLKLQDSKAMLIEAVIYPTMPINLNDRYNDGLILILEGLIKNEGPTIYCSGMLVLDNVREKDGMPTDQWTISLYIHTDEDDTNEMIFKLPVYNNYATNFLNN